MNALSFFSLHGLWAGMTIEAGQIVCLAGSSHGIAFGGPGSGWHASSGHVPGSQGGSGSPKSARAEKPASGGSKPKYKSINRLLSSKGSPGAKSSDMQVVHKTAEDANAHTKQIEEDLKSKGFKQTSGPNNVDPRSNPVIRSQTFMHPDGREVSVHTANNYTSKYTKVDPHFVNVGIQRWTGDKEYRAKAAELKAQGFTKVSHHQERGENWTNHYNPETQQLVRVRHQTDPSGRSMYARTGWHDISKPRLVAGGLTTRRGIAVR